MGSRGNHTTPWSYQKGTTALHRLPAGFKLAFLLLLSLAAFFPNLLVLSGIALILVILSLAARMRPWELFCGSGPLLLVVLAVFLVQGVELSPPGFNYEGLEESVIFCVRIGTAFAAGSLLFRVTTPGEIKKSLFRLETALHLEKIKLSLCVSLMLGFLPRFFEIWEDLNLAWQSRGGKKGLARLAVLIPLVIERMIVRAVDSALALESRGALFIPPESQDASSPP